MAGIYIHIPFCKQACNYCNFYFVTTVAQKNNFIDALIKEIDLSANYLQNETIETLYFGGGTPSLLDFADFEKIIYALQKKYDLSALKEFTIEVNPDDLTPNKIEEFVALKKYGLNRFSIGVQSFFDEDLQYMNRAHNASEAMQSIIAVKKAGFEKITIDLIYGTPTLSEKKWLENLRILKDLDLPNFSSYALTVEKKTTLYQLIKNKKTPAPIDENTVKQFDLLMDFAAKNNYEHYEISNFAKPNLYAIHNTNYWKGKNYLGLGPAAHSFNGTTRSWNFSNIKKYISHISNNQLANETELLSSFDIANEYIMTSLRTMWGCDLQHIAIKKYSRQIEKNLLLLNADWFAITNQTIYLTASGKHYADHIASQLFLVD